MHLDQSHTKRKFNIWWIIILDISYKIVNLLLPECLPLTSENRLALDRVKSISHPWAVKG